MGISREAIHSNDDLFDNLASDDGSFDVRHFNFLRQQHIDNLISQHQKSLVLLQSTSTDCCEVLGQNEFIQGKEVTQKHKSLPIRASVVDARMSTPMTPELSSTDFSSSFAPELKASKLNENIYNDGRQFGLLSALPSSFPNYQEDEERLGNLRQRLVPISHNSSEAEQYEIDKFFKKGKNDRKSKQEANQQVSFAVSGSPGEDPEEDPDDEKYKEYERFKKKDGSGRYECECSESPQWRNTKPFKGKEGYRSNGAHKSKYKEYYRWDNHHKDIEVYDDKARYLGSKDPVTGKMYRPGDMVKSEILDRLL